MKWSISLALIILFSGCVSLSRYHHLELQQQSTMQKLTQSKEELKQYRKKYKLLQDSFQVYKREANREHSATEVFGPGRSASAEATSEVTGAEFMTVEEKEILRYLNYARTQPKEFVKKLILDKKLFQTSNVKSLIKEMQRMKALSPVQADRALFEMAKCHALESGKRNYIGHKRKGCKSGYSGECCAYGELDAPGYIMLLLVDEGVPSLGHRRILLGAYEKVGISVQAHKGFGKNVVLDFW